MSIPTQGTDGPSGYQPLPGQPGVGEQVVQEHGPALESVYTMLERLEDGAEGPIWKAERVGPAGLRQLVAVKAISDYWLGGGPLGAALTDLELMNRYCELVDQHRAVRACHTPGLAVADDVFLAGPNPWFAEITSRGQLALQAPVRPVVVTGWVDGRKLEDWNDEHVDWRERLAVLKPIAEAQDEANTTGGLLLRDLKPDNVLVRADGTAVYVDYGLVLPDGVNWGVTGRSGAPSFQDRYASGPSLRGERYSFTCIIYFQLTDLVPSQSALWRPDLELVDRGYPEPLVSFLVSALSAPVGRPWESSSELLKQVALRLSP